MKMDTTVHSTVPESSEKKVKVNWVELKAEIMEVLFPGKDQAITSDCIVSRIRHRLSFDIGEDKTNGKIRKACKMLLEDDYEPVLSCQGGFYLADGVEEVEEYETSISHRIQGLQRNFKATQRIKEEMKREVRGSEYLFPEEEICHRGTESTKGDGGRFAGSRRHEE